MLVLSRHRDESIVLEYKDKDGKDYIVNVTVVDIRGDKVRLGIDAPQDVPVHRREVYDAIQRENRRSQYTQYNNENNNINKGDGLENKI